MPSKATQSQVSSQPHTRMEGNTGDKKYATAYKNYISVLLTSVLRHTVHGSSTSQPGELTTEALGKIPDGPSSLSEYLGKSGGHEHIVMGQDTSRSEGSMAANLAEWEANWKSIGGK